MMCLLRDCCFFEDNGFGNLEASFGLFDRKCEEEERSIH